MSEAKHTPGPWKFNGRSMAVYAPMPKSEVGAGYISVANCTHAATCPDIPLDERAANCRLIAAAPALLEACKLMAALPEENFHGCAVGFAIREARSAIAEATN